MKTKEVQPCGKLYSNGQEYYLLRPSPERQEMSWENWNTFRWLVVPIHINNDLDIFAYARHIITNSFVVEYYQLPKITIEILDDYDILENIPKKEKVNE